MAAKTMEGPTGSKTLVAIRETLADLAEKNQRAETLLQQVEKNSKVASAQDESAILMALEKLQNDFQKKVLAELGRLAELACQGELF